MSTDDPIATETRATRANGILLRMTLPAPNLWPIGHTIPIRTSGVCDARATLAMSLCVFLADVLTVEPMRGRRDISCRDNSQRSKLTPPMSISRFRQ